MPRLAALVLILAAGPVAAHAQAWPVGGVVSMAAVRAHAQRAPAAAPIPMPALPRVLPSPAQAPLKLKAPATLDDSDEPAPAVELRAKSEWSDDQGFRASPTRVSYKLRF